MATLPCDARDAVGRSAAPPNPTTTTHPSTRCPHLHRPRHEPLLQQDEPQGLLPEEDAQIPGGYRDAMSSNTPLGKAVRGVCEELDTLGGLVRGWAG